VYAYVYLYASCQLLIITSIIPSWCYQNYGWGCQTIVYEGLGFRQQNGELWMLLWFTCLVNV